MSEPDIVRRRYLFPCRGYRSSVRRNLVPLDQISEDSRDLLVSPIEGQLIPRLGGDVVGDNRISRVGLLESKWSARARRIFELVSTSLTSGSPTHAALYSNDSTRYGQLYVRSTNASTPTPGYNYVLGSEFGSTHYPASPGATGPHLKMIPLPYTTAGGTGTSATGYTRCAHELARRYVVPGSREVIQSGGRWLFATSYYGTPIKWDKGWNDTTASGSTDNVIQPWGNFPPLYPATHGTDTASSGTADVNWLQGDTFYVSCLFIYEDGSYSKPFVPRPSGIATATVGGAANATTAASGGLFVVGGSLAATGAESKYRSVQWTNIPIGGRGVVGRVLLRTLKVHRTSDNPSAQIIDLNPEALLIVAVLRNNTQTTYVDTMGNDTSLRADDNVVRMDHMLPPSCRHAFEFDGRTGVAHTRLNPCAIIVAPTGAVASRDLNLADNAAGLYSGSIKFSVQLDVATDGTRALRLNSKSGVSAPTTVALVPTTSTLQEMVDAINTLTVGGSVSLEWAAALVPGADGSIPCSQLAPTTIKVATCTATVAALATVAASPNDFTDVAVGMKVTGTGVSDPTYVTAKASNTALTLSQSATSSNQTLTFYSDFGDDAVITGGPIAQGNARVYGPNMQFVLGFKASFIESFTADKRSVFFTAASPFQATNAPQSFFLSNRRGGPPGAGFFQGAAPLSNGAVLAYSDAIYTLENRKGGTTGLDEDYRVYPLNRHRGCISWGSVCAGDGWVHYLTRDGLIVVDETRREICISRDLWDAGNERGSLGYEIQQCVIASGADSDVGYFQAAVLGYGLHITYRSNSGAGTPDSHQVYDFSEGADASGLAEVLRGGTTPYGWSAPLRQSFSCMTRINSATGLRYFACNEQNGGSTGDGEVQEFNPQNPTVMVGTITVNTFANAGVTLTANATGGLVNVGIGAVITGTGITNPVRVIDKDATNTFMKVTAIVGAGAAGPATLTFQNFNTRAFDASRVASSTVAVNLFTASASSLTAQAAGGFINVPVGAVLTGTGLDPLGVVVLTKDPTDTTVTITASNASAGAGNGTQITSTGSEINGIGYMAADLADQIMRRKSIGPISVLYRNPGADSVSRLLLGIIRDPARGSAREIALTATASALHNDIDDIEVPQASRSGAKWVEFYVKTHALSSSPDTTNRPEFWGLETELELLDSIL